MAKEYEIFRIILDGQREHQKDGAGTHDTNPLYHGDYTIEDYQADKKRTMEGLQELGGTARVSQYWSYQFDMTTSLRANPGEWERYDKARTEALERYDGPKEWPHGWSVGLIAQKHNLTIGRYYLEFYELTDSDLADAMDGLIGEYAKVAADMSTYQGKLIEALEGSDEWRGILDEINGAYRTIGWPDMAQGAEDLAELMTWRIHGIPWDWDFDRREDVGDPLAFILDELRGELDHAIPIAKAWTALRDLGTEYMTVRQHIEDVFHCGPIIELKLIEKLAFGDEPPQSITPEIRERINTVYREMMEAPTEGTHTMTLEGQLEAIGILDATAPNRLPSISTSPQFRPGRYKKPGEDLIVPHHQNNTRLKQSIQRTFDGAEWMNKPVTLTKKEKEDIVAEMFLKDNPYGPPTELQMDLVLQIGLFADEAIRRQEPMEVSARDLIKLFYGLSSSTKSKSIGPEQVEALETTLKQLAATWIRISPHSLRIPPKDREQLNGLIGVQKQMLTFTIKEYENHDGVTTTHKYLFTEVPPLYLINKWLQLYSLTDRTVITTPEYSFDSDEWKKLDISDDLRKKIIRKYREDKLQLDRSKESLYLHKYQTLGMKKWVLRTLGISINYDRDHGRSGSVLIDLERAYKEINGTDSVPPKKDYAWRKHKTDVMTYLLYLMIWGYIEDYTVIPDKTIRVDYADKGRIEIAGVEYYKG